MHPLPGIVHRLRPHGRPLRASVCAQPVWAALSLALAASLAVAPARASITASAPPARTSGGETVRVFAAASLTDAFRDVAAAFERTSGRRIEISFAGSQVLRTQIENGAPADVFASADGVQMDALQAAGLARNARVFARNALALVAPAGGGPVRDLCDLARPGASVVVGAATLPAGRYAATLFANVDRSGRCGAEFEARVLANVVSRETNVRLVLSKVALGEADVGVVYRTDAEAGPGQVRVIEIPQQWNVVADYPAAVLSRTTVPEAARAFVDFLLDPAGRAILRRHGFR